MLNDPVDLNAYRNRKAQLARQAHPGNFQRFLSRFKRQKQHNRVTGAEVLCARCHVPVPRNAAQCQHCGVHFSGYAGDFSTSGTTPRWIKITAGLLIIAMLATAFII